MSLWLPRSQVFLVARAARLANPRLVLGARPRPRALNHPALVAVRHQSTPSKATASTAVEDPEKNGKVLPTPPVTKADKDTEPKAPLATRAWQKVKHEAQHYWHGSKLLAKEARISARLQWKILHGESLTRRERRQVRLRLASRPRLDAHARGGSSNARRKTC
jgi:LETM1 and EF-hand domain-containing protein 1